MDQPNPTLLRKAVDERMSILDRVRVGLQAYGTQEIHFDLDDFAASIRLSRSSVYQALHRIDGKELELLKEPFHGSDKREKISGVRLLKMQAATDILEQAAQRPAPVIRPTVMRTSNGMNTHIPNLMTYIKKKSMLDKIKNDLIELGYDPNSALNLPIENDLAEEGVYVYEKWQQTQALVNELQQQIELLNREKNILAGNKNPVIEVKVAEAQEEAMATA